MHGLRPEETFGKTFLSINNYIVVSNVPLSMKDLQLMQITNMHTIFDRAHEEALPHELLFFDQLLRQEPAPA